MPPAARIADLHNCPATTGTIPHVGGPILGPGEPTVLIGNMPAAVVGDTVGDPFKDTSGPSMNILINVMAMVSLVISSLLPISGMLF